MTGSQEIPTNHVILSGGSRGLGMALAKALLEAGYRVSTFSRRHTEFTESLANDSRFLFGTADVSDSKSISRFTASAVERFGPPYGLVNCAGIAVDGVLAMMPEDRIDNVLQINLGVEFFDIDHAHDRLAQFRLQKFDWRCVQLHCLRSVLGEKFLVVRSGRFRVHVGR